MRWGLLGLLLWFLGATDCGLTQVYASEPWFEDDFQNYNEVPVKKKHKHKKKKSHKKKKPHKSKKHRPKGKQYSAKNIEKLLENDQKNEFCNRLNCASDLGIAKSCLNTKASHREHRGCFHAFCAYGCNDEDYKTNLEVFDFCNQICSSKKYLKE